MEHYLKAIRRQARIERIHEALLKLPTPVVFGLIWLAGTLLLCLYATALYLCWWLLLAVG